MYIQLTDGKNNFLLQIMCFFWEGEFFNVEKRVAAGKAKPSSEGGTTEESPDH